MIPVAEATTAEAEGLAELATKSLWHFVQQAWDIVEQGQSLVPTWHLPLICEELEMVTRGQTRLLVICVPPGTSKSRIVAVMWPAWEWLNFPHLRSIYVSTGNKQAARDSRYTRQIIASDWYANLVHRQAQLGRTQGWGFARDLNQVVNFANTINGQRFCLSMGGNIQGERGNKLVVDDPYDLDELREASTERRAEIVMDAIDKWDNILATRLNDARSNPRVLIMQRVANGDLAENLILRPGVRHVVLPMEYDPSDITWKHPKDPRTEPGELLCPGFMPPEVVADKRGTMSPAQYAAQFQQRPTPQEGRRYKRAWFDLHRYEYEPHFLARQMDEVLISVDAANKAGARNDRSALHVWGKRNLDYFILDRKAERMEFLGLKTCFEDLCNEWPEARLKLIEDAANGTALISSCKDRIAGIIPVNVQAERLSKEGRSAFAEAAAETGHVWVPKSAPWVASFIEEVIGFGAGGLHDDDVDAMSQAIRRWAAGITSWLTSDHRVRLARPIPGLVLSEHVTRWARRTIGKDVWGGIVPGWAQGRPGDECVAVLVDERGCMASAIETAEGGHDLFVSLVAMEADYWMDSLVEARYAELPGAPAPQVIKTLGARKVRVASWPTKKTPHLPGQVGAGWVGSKTETAEVWSSFLSLLGEGFVQVPDGRTLALLETVVEQDGVPMFPDGSPLRGRLLALLLALSARKDSLGRTQPVTSGKPRFTFMEEEGRGDVWSVGPRR